MAKKTKLTASLRNFIRPLIVADIPQIDYETQIQDFLNKAARNQLPFDLQRAEFQEYLGKAKVSFAYVFVANTKFNPTPAQIHHVKKLQTLDEEQHDNLLKAARNIQALLDSFTYVEDLIEQVPEFAKYIPIQEAPLTNLPAVQLTEQLHALGWPKSDEGK